MKCDCNCHVYHLSKDSTGECCECKVGDPIDKLQVENAKLRAEVESLVNKNTEIKVEAFHAKNERDAALLQNSVLKSALDWICGYAHIRGLKDIEARCEEVSPSEKPIDEAMFQCPHCPEKFDIRGGHLCAEKRKQEPPIEDPKSIGHCPNCGAPVYTMTGFCGICRPC